MAGDKTATFGIKVKAETNAETAAVSVESLRDSILSSQEAVKQYGSALRNLRGTSDEVASAKAKLKAAQDAERSSISQGVLQLGKMGTNLAALASADKLRSQESAKSSAAKAAYDAALLRKVDAARAKVRKKNEEEEAAATAKEKTRQAVKLNLWVNAGKAKAAASEKSEAAMRAAMGATMGAASALAASILAVNAAVLAGAVAIGKWIIEDANALRTMGLVNEAALQTASNALHMGHQIDALGSKVSFTRAELQGMQLDISRSLAGTRVSGQGIVDTFNAVAQVSDAMGASAGKAIQGIIERGKQFGRVGIGLFELQGTGLTFEGVAEQLGKQLQGGIDEARQRLFLGRVEIDKAALALRQAAEKRFANLNLSKMLDINVIGKKFRDTLASLTDGVDLEPLLVGLKSFAGLFSATTVEGRATKALVTGFGNAIVATFGRALPLLRAFFTQLVIEGMRLGIFVLDLKDKLKGTFGAELLGKLFSVETAIKAAKVVVYGLAGAVAVAAAALAAGIAILYDLYKAGEAVYDFFVESTDWSYLGTAIVDGIKNGVTGAAGALKDAVTGLAEGVKKTFTGIFDMHSPSKVSEGWGKNIGAGTVRGLDKSRSEVQAATERMAPQAPAMPVMQPAPEPPNMKSYSSGDKQPVQAGDVNVNVTLAFPNATDGASVEQTLSSPDFQTKFTLMLERIMRSRGVPTQKAGA